MKHFAFKNHVDLYKHKYYCPISDKLQPLPPPEQSVKIEVANKLSMNGYEKNLSVIGYLLYEVRTEK